MKKKQGLIIIFSIILLFIIIANIDQKSESSEDNEIKDNQIKEEAHKKSESTSVSYDYTFPKVNMSYEEMCNTSLKQPTWYSMYNYIDGKFQDYYEIKFYWQNIDEKNIFICIYSQKDEKVINIERDCSNEDLSSTTLKSSTIKDNDKLYTKGYLKTPNIKHNSKTHYIKDSGGGDYEVNYYDNPTDFYYNNQDIFDEYDDAELFYYDNHD